MNPIISYSMNDYKMDKWIEEGIKLAKEYKLPKIFMKQWEEKGLNCNLLMRLSEVLNQQGNFNVDGEKIEEKGVTKKHFAEILVQQAKYMIALKNEMYYEFEKLKDTELTDQEIIILNEKLNNWAEGVTKSSMFKIGNSLLKEDEESKEVSENTIIYVNYRTVGKRSFWVYTVTWWKSLSKYKEEPIKTNLEPFTIDLDISKELLVDTECRNEENFKYKADDLEYLSFYNYTMWDDWIEFGVKMASNDVLPSKFIKQWKKKGLSSNLFKEVVKNYRQETKISSEEFGELLTEQVERLMVLKKEMRAQYDRAVKEEHILEFEMEFTTKRFFKWEESLDVLVKMGQQLFKKEKSGRAINPNADVKTKYIVKKRKKYVRYSVVNSNKVTS